MKDIASSDPDSFYKAGAAWLQKNVPANDLVFNTDWDDFPRLFYYDPTHRYITGLDPTYLYDRDPALSKLYDRITLGKEEDPGPLACRLKSFSNPSFVNSSTFSKCCVCALPLI